MIPYQNCEIFASIIFYLLTKFLCVIFSYPMYKHSKLSSIPEKNENEEEVKTTKWVPKKKHEVLKAKYKCLKKLFQIYDASVIGILPETFPDDYTQDSDSRTKYSRRKKRSHRTKTDACAGTNEVSSGDVSIRSDDKSTIATAVIKDLKIQCSCSTQMISEKTSPKFHESKENISNSSSERDCEFTQTEANQQLQMPLPTPMYHPIPYLMYNEKRKLTRFQSFINRLFGGRRERTYRNYVSTNGHVYAASDNNITHNYGERRRRRGLRFRRLKRPKKVHSEIALRDLKSPTILTYVQSVQRNCLMDTTPRQCPIAGCKMMFYGIINYNDHLNLCHFTDRKFICHYCHEGFEREYDKYVHENEHLGITRLTNYYPSSTKAYKKVSNTQTDPINSKCDVPEEKLKKIVSFFDKIADTEQMLTELKKDRFSESNLQTIRRSSKTNSETTEMDTMTNSSSDKRTVSCGNLLNRKLEKSKTTIANSDKTSKFLCSPVKCQFCGEHFDFRRQLSLHVDLEHRVHDKYSKFHSCAGITNTRRSDLITEKGKINVQSVSKVQRVDTSSTLSQDSYSMVRRKSDESLSCDPSTNIIYYESTDNVRKPSAISSFVDKVRSGVTSYRWEPGTKIIRV